MILGTRQSGVPSFLLGNLQEDQKIIQQAKLDAQTVLENSDSEEFSDYINKIRNRIEEGTNYRN